MEAEERGGSGGSKWHGQAKDTGVAFDSDAVSCKLAFAAQANAGESSPVCGDTTGAQGDQSAERPDCQHGLAGEAEARIFWSGCRFCGWYWRSRTRAIPFAR